MGGRTEARLPRSAAAFLAVVVVAAGASGVALLMAPGSTHRYFSWTLQPPAAASLIGGFYLASAAAFGAALALPWRQVRPFLIAVLGLAVPTLILTVVHDEVFDFSRWQAVAWVVLFVTAPVSTVAILATNPPARAAGGPLARAAGGPLVRRSTRLVLAALAVGLGSVACLIWLDATRDDVARFSPVELVRLTGAYLGAWCSFLAVPCAWAAWRGRWDDARGALITLAAAGAGASIAFLRSFADVRHAGAALAVALAVTGFAVLAYVAEGSTS